MYELWICTNVKLELVWGFGMNECCRYCLGGKFNVAWVGSMVGFCCELSMNMNVPLFYSHVENIIIGECMYINIDGIDPYVYVVCANES